MKIIKNGWLLAGLLGFLLVFTVIASPAIAQKVQESNISIIPVREEVLVAPGHRIAQKDLLYQNGILSFPVKDFHLGKTKGTSMLPMAGTGHLVILTKDFKIEELGVGDFVVIEQQILKGILKPYFHQIVEIGQDERGWFAETKGINNRSEDLLTARKEDVKYLALGILW
jgi:hypothetical protein